MHAKGLRRSTALPPLPHEVFLVHRGNVGFDTRYVEADNHKRGQLLGTCLALTARRGDDF